MKAFLYKMKGAVALALAMSLFCPQVFAAEEQPVAVVAELPQLTYEEALKRAKKHSPDLRELQATADFLQETKEDIWDILGGFDQPTYEYQKWVDDGWHALMTATFTTNLGMQQTSLGKKVTELSLEVAVKSCFMSMIENEDQLELVKKNAEIQQRLYVQGQTKRRLGMISKYELDKLRLAAEQAKGTVTLLEAALEQEYIKFNSMIGGSPGDRYELVYDLTFEPYTTTQTMEQLVNDKVNNKDLTIKLKELSLEKAKFDKNYLSYSTTQAQTDQNEMKYDTAKRELKTAKENKETLVRNAYLQIQQLETQYASAEADLAKAQADYRVAQINYQAGNVTKTLVEQAEMGMITAENAVKQLVYTHDMLVFTFENPSLLIDTSAVAASASN